jgi:aminopeptidase N
VQVEENFEEGVYELILDQDFPAGEGQENPAPMHIPVRMGLLGKDGEPRRLLLEGETSEEVPKELILELREKRQVFRFRGLDEKPIASLFRGFSAPVRVGFDRPREELAFLMAHDRDAFQRWESGQELMTAILLERIDKGEAWEADPLFVEAWGSLLGDEGLDGSLKALALQLPAERVLAQEMDVVDPDAIHSACKALAKSLLGAHGAMLLRIYNSNVVAGPYSNDRASIDARRLKNLCLGFLLTEGDPEALALAQVQFVTANNMTDSNAALACLADHVSPATEAALSGFYEKWKDDPLVLDKWFTVQALSSARDTFEQVVKLSEHRDFNLDNPNRTRSLLGAFGMGNQRHFHRQDGKAYRFLADKVLELDKRNHQVAARMVSCFNNWKRFDKERQALMLAELRRIHASEGLSRDVTEILERALGQAS